MYLNKLHKKTAQKIKDKESEYQNNISKHNEASSILYEAKRNTNIFSELQIELQFQLSRRYELEQSIYELHAHLINIVSKNITHQTGIKIDLSKSVKRNIQKTIDGCYDCSDLAGISSMFDEFS
jgi:Mor family transcriptional regulator